MLKRLGNLSMLHVIIAGMGCGFLVMACFVVMWVLTTQFGPSFSGQITLEIEPFLTAMANDAPTETPSVTATTEMRWFGPPSGDIVYTCFH